MQDAMDYNAMSDGDLADALGAMYDDLSAGNLEEWEQEGMLWAENEVCDRLGLDGSETEQGLTPYANGAIFGFLTCHRTGGRS